ncbi:MAG TPA: class I SAM-dependent methyltransferase [Actinomycetota bacterium]|jgi:2-polyprenyl-3-methyl-5-hydroxy-6-metoxy-1,4-benzoquinol methylase
MVDVDTQRDELVERLFGASLGMAEVLTVYLGDTLGLYRAMERAGSTTSGELADATGIFERYAREWLEQQAAAGIVTVDDAAAAPAERAYRLPPGHVEPLLDPDSPFSMAAFCKSFVAASSAMPELVKAFRSGGPVPWQAFGRDMIEAQGDFNRPWLLGSFGTEYLPSIPDLHDRLSSEPGARVADVACGVGWAAISLAKAYPNVRVDGFDLDELSIELAARNAAEAGVADRVTFTTTDASSLEHRETYDLATVIESIHDMSQPVAVLAAIRQMLKPGGTLIVADERTEDAFTAPASEIERVFYAYSVLCCLPSAMDDHTSAATGTVMRRATFEAYARQAGFGEVSVLPIEHDFLRFYRLDR